MKIGEVIETSDKHWYYPSTKQVTDPGYLAELMSDPDQASVVLKHSGHTDSGTPSAAHMRVEWSHLSVTQIGTLKAWLGLSRSERSVRSLGGLLEIVGTDDIDSVGHFDEGYVSLRNEGAPATQIFPDSEVDQFTYPMGKTRPSDEAWRSAVQERMAILDDSLSWGS